MILECFPHAFEGRTVLLLHGGDRDEVTELQGAFCSLAQLSTLRVAVHRLPFVQAPFPCALLAEVASVDQGVTSCESPNSFEWRQTPAGWKKVAELLSPFIEEPGGGFQYLNEHSGPEVIFSTSRAW